MSLRLARFAALLIAVTVLLLGGTAAWAGRFGGAITTNACADGHFASAISGPNGLLTCQHTGSSSSTAFTDITTGTNTVALHMGTSGTLSTTAGGIINANRVAHRTVSGFSGSTGTLATTTGTMTNQDCVKIDASGNLVANGSACGSGTPSTVSHNAVQFNNAGSFGGSGNFVFHAVGNVLHLAGNMHISGNLHVAGSFAVGGTGTGSIEMPAGAFGVGGANKVHIGAHTGSIFAVSQNAGPVTHVPLCGGDLHCVASNLDPTVKGFELSNEGRLGTVPVTSSFPNDRTTGTTVNLLAKITHAGAMTAGLTEGNIPFYIVHAGAGTTGSARLVVAGQGLCVMHATASGTQGWHVVAASTGTAGRCHAQATMPSGAYSLGIVVDNATTAGSTARVLVGGPQQIPTGSAATAVKTMFSFMASAGQPLVSHTASTMTTRNGHTVQSFPDADNTAIAFPGVLPPHYNGGGLSCTVHGLVSGTATTGAASLDLSIERLADEGQDLDADGFATAKTGSWSAPATAGMLQYLAFTFANGAEMDSLAAGEAFRIKLRRDGNGTVATDDLTDAFYLRSLECREQ